MRYSNITAESEIAYLRNIDERPASLDRYRPESVLDLSINNDNKTQPAEFMSSNNHLTQSALSTHASILDGVCSVGGLYDVRTVGGLREVRIVAGVREVRTVRGLNRVHTVAGLREVRTCRWSPRSSRNQTSVKTG